MEAKRTDDIIANVVHRTTDYDMFHHLNGNRAVLEPRIRKIVKSIQEVGYICNPIIVNERMEVADGQGRLEALKRLGMPVEYIVVQGLTDVHCAALNRFQTNWNLRDYVQSYADVGNPNYKHIEALLEEYPGCPIDTVVSAIRHELILYGANSALLKSGKIKCNVEEYNNARRLLNIAEELRPYIVTKGSAQKGIAALIAVMKMDKTDIDRLRDKVRKYFATEAVVPFISVAGAVKAIEDAYNYRQITSTRVSFSAIYEEQARKKDSAISAASKRRKKGKA